MIEFKGHFDGKVVVPDEPVGLRAGDRVLVRPETQTAHRPITAAELAAIDFGGAWAERTDIVDSTEFVRDLRRKIERREL